MHGKPEHFRRSHFGAAAWLLLFLVLPLAAGCTAWHRACDRAAADRRQFLEALAPLADPRGGATTDRGREIEQGIEKSAAYLP
jgi:hypothetical protein